MTREYIINVKKAKRLDKGYKAKLLLTSPPGIFFTKYLIRYNILADKKNEIFPKSFKHMKGLEISNGLVQSKLKNLLTFLN